MKRMKEFAAFVEKERISDIRAGQSGAVVCEISGNRIAKLIQRKMLAEEGLWEKYAREAEFYRSVQEMALPFVPKALYIGMKDDEMLLVLEKYRPIDRSAISDTLLAKVTQTLARIHTLPVPGFAEHKERKPLEYTAADTEMYVSGWESVLSEHQGAFSADGLQALARDINEINHRFHSQRVCFTHGDFHFDNLLQDEEGNVVVCDWQGCGYGDPSGDLSFLISRLLSDGYPLEAEALVISYCRHANEMGLDVSPTHVHCQMALSNLNISFMYWHVYLHNAAKERVDSIYGKMLADYLLLKSMM